MDNNADVQRWYDGDIFLMSLFYSLERLTMTSLYHFVKTMEILINQKSPSNRLNIQGVSELPLPKAFVENRRWYDHYPELKRTLGQLYVLDFDTQVDIAHELFIPSQIIAKYELYSSI